jgi:chromosomal replication initiation ATPase DnaA
MEYENFNITDLKTAKVLKEAVYQTLPPDEIIDMVIESCGHDPMFMKQKMFDRDKFGKFQKIVDVKRACMFFLRRHTKMSLASIGDLFGHKHDNVLYHVRKFNGRLENGFNPEVLIEAEFNDKYEKATLQIL